MEITVKLLTVEDGCNKSLTHCSVLAWSSTSPVLVRWMKSVVRSKGFGVRLLSPSAKNWEVILDKILNHTKS